MKVELHIGRLVLHDVGEFDHEAFVGALEAELAARLPPGADAFGVAQRFAAQKSPAAADQAPAAPGQDAATVAARGVAARLVG